MGLAVLTLLSLGQGCGPKPKPWGCVENCTVADAGPKDAGPTDGGGGSDGGVVASSCTLLSTCSGTLSIGGACACTPQQASATIAVPVGIDHFVSIGVSSGGTPFVVGAADVVGSNPYTFPLDMSTHPPTLLARKLVGNGFPTCQLQGTIYEGVDVVDGVEGRMSGICTSSARVDAICFDGSTTESVMKSSPAGGGAMLSTGGCITVAGDSRSLYEVSAGWSRLAGTAANIRPASLGRFGSRDAYLYVTGKNQAALVQAGTTTLLGPASAHPLLSELGGTLWSMLPQRLGPILVNEDASDRCDLTIPESANFWEASSTIVVDGGLLLAYGVNNGNGDDELVFDYLRPGVGVEQVRVPGGLIPSKMKLFSASNLVYMATIRPDTGVLQIDPLCQ